MRLKRLNSRFTIQVKSNFTITITLFELAIAIAHAAFATQSCAFNKSLVLQREHTHTSIMRPLNTFYILATCCPLAFADVEFTVPAAGAS
jgi:hypothetical protein